MRLIDADDLKRVFSECCGVEFLLGSLNKYVDSMPTIETVDNKARNFTSEDFTEKELMLLRLAFTSMDVMLNNLTVDNYGYYLSNDLYYLKEKLGIIDVVE